VTNEHIVSDSASVVISGRGLQDQLATTVLLDYTHDVALLRPAAPLDLPEPGELAVEKFLSDTGVLPDFGARQLTELVEEYVAGEASAGRCIDCERLVFERTPAAPRLCPHCGAGVTLPSMITDQTPTGVEATIEEIILAAGYDPRLSRRGPCLWSIRRGSATIQLAYHEDSGLIIGDAYLCRLPREPTAALFAYLLQENYALQQLTLSTHDDDIILSLLIYDRYLRLNTALPYFERLFERADAYDDVLVEQYGTQWRTS